jgi:serine/threonine protein kinase
MLSSMTRYVAVGPVGAGGMGTVELALRVEGKFRRLYAIKRLKPELQGMSELQEMMFDEARIAGLIRHPNVVSAIDFGVDESGPYLVMDFIEGLPLGAILQHAASEETPIPIAQALEIVAQTARGLHAAHELRSADGAPLELVHRDVSPSNVLVGFDGIVRVTDFGIAKVLDAGTQTTTGILKGKLAYMAPDQLRFEKVDRRTDIYALGVVMFELLAGRRLYPSSDTSDVGFRILNEPAPDLSEECPEAPPQIVELAFEMLAKDRELRPRTAAQVADRIEAVLASDPSLASRQSLAGYLRATFPEAHASIHRRATDAIAGTMRPEELVPSDITDAPTTPRRVRRRRTALIASSAIAVVLLAFAAGVGLAIDRSAPPSRSIGTPPAATAAEPAATVAEPAATVAEPAAIAAEPAAIAAEPAACRVSAAETETITADRDAGPRAHAARPPDDTPGAAIEPRPESPATTTRASTTRSRLSRRARPASAPRSGSPSRAPQAASGRDAPLEVEPWD